MTTPIHKVFPLLYLYSYNFKTIYKYSLNICIKTYLQICPPDSSLDLARILSGSCIKTYFQICPLDSSLDPVWIPSRSGPASNLSNLSLRLSSSGSLLWANLIRLVFFPSGGTLFPNTSIFRGHSQCVLSNQALFFSLASFSLFFPNSKSFDLLSSYSLILVARRSAWLGSFS